MNIFILQPPPLLPLRKPQTIINLTFLEIKLIVFTVNGDANTGVYA